MVSFDCFVSGGQIASALASDPEEIWYCLKDLADNTSDRFLQEIADYACGGEARDTADWLRELANKLDSR